jgi:hypothetical protein
MVVSPFVRVARIANFRLARFRLCSAFSRFRLSVDVTMFPFAITATQYSASAARRIASRARSVTALAAGPPHLVAVSTGTCARRGFNAPAEPALSATAVRARHRHGPRSRPHTALLARSLVAARLARCGGGSGRHPNVAAADALKACRLLGGALGREVSRGRDGDPGRDAQQVWRVPVAVALSSGVVVGQVSCWRVSMNPALANKKPVRRDAQHTGVVAPRAPSSASTLRMRTAPCSFSSWPSVPSSSRCSSVS